jgi:hypothetical protein
MVEWPGCEIAPKLSTQVVADPGKSHAWKNRGVDRENTASTKDKA